MKKYPSYATLNNLNNGKKLSLVAKYQKSASGINTAKSTSRSTVQTNLTFKKKESQVNQSAKKPSQFLKKDSVIEKVKTQANQNKQEKQDYEALKNRLHALEDRLVQIKKSYEIRKNKGNHFSIQKTSLKLNLNKGNQKIEKPERAEKQIALKNRELNIQVKTIGLDYKNVQERHAVQSPKVDPTMQKSSIFKQKIEQQKKESVVQQNSEAILSEYVTQYEQKPVAFKHTSSETNLFRPIVKDKDNSKKELNNEQIYYISSLIRAIETSKPNSFDQLCAGHLLASYQFLCYVKSAGIQKPAKPVIKALPPPTKKHTIIFDLDETLIHCLDSKKSSNADICLPVLFPDRKQIIVGINIRPYTRECLKELSKYFEIMVFTASHANYASAIVDFLDPQRQYISHKFSRQSCYKTQEGFYVKDLRVVDRKLSNILLIDNAAYSYCFQPENGVPIVPYYDNKADLELKNLIPYLRPFLNENDVRVRNSEVMKLADYTKCKGPQDVINRLYK